MVYGVGGEQAAVVPSPQRPAASARCAGHSLLEPCTACKYKRSQSCHGTWHYHHLQIPTPTAHNFERCALPRILLCQTPMGFCGIKWHVIFGAASVHMSNA